MIQATLMAGGGALICILAAYLYGKSKGKRAAEIKHLEEGVESVVKTQERNNKRSTHSRRSITDWMLRNGSRD